MSKATAPKTHRAAGEIVHLAEASCSSARRDPERGMGAMTIRFDAPNGIVPPGFKVGRPIQFEFSMQSDGHCGSRRSRRPTRACRTEGAQMIAALIRGSIANRFLVLLATLALAAWGTWAALRTPLDAIPDLSDVQVIWFSTTCGGCPGDRIERRAQRRPCSPRGERERREQHEETIGDRTRDERRDHLRALRSGMLASAGAIFVIRSWPSTAC